MSHEHRQNPERYYDDEGEAYPDYDDVIAYAKAQGWDPFDGHGEYKPAVISAAERALAPDDP